MKDGKDSAEVVSALRTLIEVKFKSGRARTVPSDWTGQLKGPPCLRQLALKLARSMRHHKGNRKEFDLLREAEISLDDEASLAARFLIVLKTMKGVLGYSSKEESWFLVEKGKQRSNAAPSTHRRTNPGRLQAAT